jgi:hexokinase|tara:strand:- start:10987 stop:11298 length:312 start_codon:yes stop_codon:yes gene_type:complete
MAQFYIEEGKRIAKFEDNKFILLANVSEINKEHNGYPINEIILTLLKHKDFELITIQEQTQGGKNIFKARVNDYLSGAILRTKQYPRHKVIPKSELDWREMFY